MAPEGIAPRTVGIGRKGGVDWPPLSESATHLIPWLHHYQKGLTQAPVPLLPEVLLALNATVEGQSTAHYVSDQLSNSGVAVSRLAQGVPMGGELDYLDEGTLAAAFKARRKI